MSRPQRTKERHRHTRKARSTSIRVSPWARHVGQCAATTKRQFETKQAAKTVNRSQGGHLTPYRCTSCGYFHLGSPLGMTREEHRAVHANDPSHIDVALGVASSRRAAA